MSTLRIETNEAMEKKSMNEEQEPIEERLERKELHREHVKPFVKKKNVDTAKSVEEVLNRNIIKSAFTVVNNAKDRS
jgi:hypothetical protein